MQPTTIELIPTCSYCKHHNLSGTHCGMCRRRLKVMYDNNVRNTPTQPTKVRNSGFPRATVVSPLVSNQLEPTKGWFYRKKMDKVAVIDQLLSE